MNSSILILGCGYVGTRLGEQLAADGYHVIGAKRHPASLPDSIEPLQLDIADQAALDALPSIDVLVYAISADKFEDSAYQCAYPTGLHNVLSIFEQRHEYPRYTLFVSSTSVYAQSEGEVVDEHSPAQSTSFSGVLMRQAEQRLQKSPLHGSVVRFSGIYGPGRERLINQVCEGAVAAEQPEVMTNRIHRDDAAGVLEFLIQRALAGKHMDDLYLATDSYPSTLHDVTHWLARRLGVTPHAVLPTSKRRGSNKRCSNARLLEQGYRFTFPDFREGYGQVLNEQGK